MSSLALIQHDDPAVLYRVEQDGDRVGEVQPHARHAAILRLCGQAWWLVDDVAYASHAAGTSPARSFFRHLLLPRQFSLREDSSERVLAEARRRWRWSTKRDGIELALGEMRTRIRYLSVWGGRLALQGSDGRGLAELAFGSFGRRLQIDGPLPFGLAESVFALYATHRIFGYRIDEGATGE